MKAKYTTEHPHDIIRGDDRNLLKWHKIIARFENYKDAEFVCRLLNENEARKNIPKIKKIHKSDIINFLISLAEIKNSTEYLKTAKIIDSLEADDG